MARTRDLWKDPARRGHGKRWLAVWTGPDGKEHAQAFAKKSEADRYGAAQETDAARGTYIDPRSARVTVGQWCDTWLAGYASKRPGTVAQARVHIRQIKAEFGTTGLAAVRPSQVNAWTARLRAEDYEASYVNRLHGRLAQIMTAAAEDGLILRSPCSRKTSPGAGKQRPYVITTEQMWALHAEIPPGLQIAILLGAMAGLRTAEVCGLRAGDVDLLLGIVRPRVQWPAEPLKTETSMTDIPVPHSLTTEIIAHMAMWPGATVLADEDGRPVGPWMLKRAVARARAKVPGLPAAFRYHDLRHYLASFLIAHGADVKLVQARLRHASAKTTLDTYGHLWPDRDESTRTALEAVFDARPEQGRNKGKIAGSNARSEAP